MEIEDGYAMCQLFVFPIGIKLMSIRGCVADASLIFATFLSIKSSSVNSAVHENNTIPMLDPL